jgi:acyl-CoA dehydrogenase
MNEHIQLLLDSLERVLQRETPNVAGQAEVERQWDELAALGLMSFMANEDQGGGGANWSEAAHVAMLAGKYAACAPVPEIFMAAGIAGGILPPDAGHRLVLAPRAQVDVDARGTAASGRVLAVACGRSASHLLVPLQDGRRFALVSARGAEVVRGTNQAGEARDELKLRAAAVEGFVEGGRLMTTLVETCAVMRACQMAGALTAALELCVAHCNVREQFGRRLAALQVIQHDLARFAELTAAAGCASHAASCALDAGDIVLGAASAKLSANKAAALGTMIAHQVHGAIGFTQEYGLHRFTRRAWAWRQECGHDAYWARRLGEHMRAQGAGSFWATMTASEGSSRLQ